MLEAISSVLDDDLVAALNDSPVCSWILDGSSVISKKKQLVIYVGYLLADFVHVVNFLCIVEIPGGDAATVFDNLREALQSRGKDTSKFYGLGSDAASVMTGGLSGVCTRWKQSECPHAVAMHCHAHRVRGSCGVRCS